MARIIGLWILAAVICSAALAQINVPLKPDSRLSVRALTFKVLGFNDAVVRKTGTAKETHALSTGQVWMGALGNNIGEPDMVEVLFKSVDYDHEMKAGQGRGRAIGQMQKIIGKMQVSMPSEGIVVKRSEIGKRLGDGKEIKAVLKIMKVRAGADEVVASAEWPNPQSDADGWFEIETADRQPAGKYYLLGGFRLDAGNNVMAALRGGKDNFNKMVRVSQLSAASADEE